jgi:nitrile hydratase subunit beta
MTGEMLSERRYQNGARVQVRNSNPPGHCRVPVYIRGQTGAVERYCGAFANPSERAYGFDGLPKRHLYRVRFQQVQIWDDYDGPDGDTLDLELYEHWLTPAEEP